MIKVKKIFEILIDQISSFFFYFFIFYIICLSVALFYDPWRLFFNWKAFSISLFFLGMISLFNDKLDSISIFKISIRKSSIIKFFIIISILIYFVGHNIRLVEFLILCFGLIALFFGIGFRFAALTAMFFLLLIPIFSLLEDAESVKMFAVYAYYFLIIMAILQFKDFKSNNQSNLEH